MDRDREDRDELWEDEDLFAVEGLDDDEGFQCEGEAGPVSDEALFEQELSGQDVPDAFAGGEHFDGFDPSVDELEVVEEPAEPADPIYGEMSGEAPPEAADWSTGMDDEELWETGEAAAQEVQEVGAWGMDEAAEMQAAQPTFDSAVEWEDASVEQTGDAFDVSAEVDDFFGTQAPSDLSGETVEFELGQEVTGFYETEVGGQEPRGESYDVEGYDTEDAAEEWFDETESAAEVSAIDHGFQPSSDLDGYEQAEGIQADALGEIANLDPSELGYVEGDPRMEGSFEGFDLEVDAEAEVDEREFVSWDEDGDSMSYEDDDDGFDSGTGAEGDPGFRDPHRPLEITDGQEEYDEYDEEDFDAEGEWDEERPAGSRIRLVLMIGSVLAAACLVVLGKLVFLDGSEEEPMLQNASVTTPKRNVPNPGVASTATTETTEATETTETTETTTETGESSETVASNTAETTETGEVGPETTQPEGSEVASNTGETGETTPNGSESNPGTGPTGENVAVENGETTDPGLGTDPVGELTPSELGELFPEGSGDPLADAGEAEAEAELFKQEVRIPADTWSEPNRAALMVADVIMHRSAVRVLLKNGNEFRGNLHKLDPQRIELKIDKGEIGFHYDELSEIFPLESPDLRLQHHPEGFVEFKNHSRLWGRIVDNGPKAVTMAFGQTRILIPRHAVVSVEERPMFTMSMEPEGESQAGE